jgi:hypothetical protein
MRRVLYGISLMLAGLAQAADPASSPVAAGAPSPTAKTNVPAWTAGKPLDLRLGDIRRYITPEDYRALMGAPAMEANTVIVQADAPLLPEKSSQPIPGGIMAPFWALAHPTQAWRLLVPDLKRPPDGPTEDKVPPPVFRWGP